MAILVTGGAGYIGSHTVARLLEKGYDVLVADSLENGHRESIPDVPLHVGDLRDNDFLKKIFSENIEAVIHFAAYIEVAESVKNPLKFFNNNVTLSLNLLKYVTETKVNKIVFSSTAGVYGIPQGVPINENDTKNPLSPYGESKLMIEKSLKWVADTSDLKYAALRYFNAAGAHESGKIGEDHHPESHIIPLMLQTILGIRDKFTLFGEDYNTEDGSCVRDYVHVNDLADAHILALEYLKNGRESNSFNLGNGKGFSNKEIIKAVEKVTGLKVNVDKGPRRPGDPDALIASSQKAKDVLGWNPSYTDLEKIIATAWNWHKNNPSGYIKK